MKNLFYKIFISFWLTISITVCCAALAGYYYHQRMEQIYTNFDFDEVILKASEILDTQGMTGLKVCLRNTSQRNQYPYRIFIINEKSQDILGRKIPRRIFDWQDHFNQSHHRGDKPPNRLKRRGQLPPSNLRTTNFIPFLIGPDNQRYRVFSVPRNTSVSGYFNDNLRWFILFFSIFLSILISYLITRSYMKPFRHFKDATVAISEGKLKTRISKSISNRNDEMGELARDLDAMTEKLYRASENHHEMARNISHELRSPLSRMHVALEIAEQKTGKNVELERIKREINTLNDLIEYILKYSKLDASENEIPTLINLNELTQDVVNNINFEYKNNKECSINIKIKVNEEVFFKGHEDGLRSAFENVLRNSMKYGPNDSEVIFDLKSREDDIEITITDSGKGVKESDRDKIFEPFFRHVDNNRNDQPNGSGLGLAIAKRAIEWNRGTIEAITTNQNFVIKINLPKDTKNTS